MIRTLPLVFASALLTSPASACAVAQGCPLITYIDGARREVVDGSDQSVGGDINQILQLVAQRLADLRTDVRYRQIARTPAGRCYTGEASAKDQHGDFPPFQQFVVNLDRDEALIPPMRPGTDHQPAQSDYRRALERFLDMSRECGT